MLAICEKFAAENNIRFSTDPIPSKSKSKAMLVIGQRQNVSLPAPFVLCGTPLPWVNRCDHLGHILISDGMMIQDCKETCAQFIDSAVKMQEMFSFAHPSEIIFAIDKH